MLVLLLVVVAHLVGSLPTAAVVGRRRGFDPHLEGSGNPGATNALRLGGRRAGLTVLAADALKGAVPAAIGLALGGSSLAVLLGASAVLGHVLPVTRGGRGGKGVATTAGMALVAVPGPAVLALATFVAVLAGTRVVSVASVAAAAALPVLTWVLGGSVAEVLGLGVVAVVVVVRHRGNLARVRQGTEPALRARVGADD